MEGEGEGEITGSRWLSPPAFKYSKDTRRRGGNLLRDHDFSTFIDLEVSPASAAMTSPFSSELNLEDGTGSVCDSDTGPQVN